MENFPIFKPDKNGRNPDMTFSAFMTQMRVAIIAMGMAKTKATKSGSEELQNLLRESSKRGGVYLEDFEKFVGIKKTDRRG